MYLFWQAKKKNRIPLVFISANGKLFENFEFINFSRKEKTIKKDS